MPAFERRSSLVPVLGASLADYALHALHVHTSRCALYLQALHPRVIRGTLQNAPGITQAAEGWVRLKRTRKHIEARTFGTMAEAERAGRRVRAIHHALTGTDPDGTRYRLDEPDLLLWVHCGEVASCADIARRRRLPFSAAMRAVHRAESAGEVLR